MKKKLKDFLIWDYSDVKDDVFYKAEIQANKIFAIVMFNCGILMFVIYLLKLFGLFNLPNNFWISAIEIFVELTVPAILCFIFKGRKKWLKYILVIEFCVVVARIDSLLTFYVPILLCIPTILSCRYYQKAATLTAAITTAVLMIIVEMFWYKSQLFFDWNIYADEAILAGSINPDNIGFNDYSIKILTLETLPRLLLFGLVAVICIESTKAGKILAAEDLQITEANSKMKSELTLATDIQASMLPSIFPPFPEYEEFDLFATMTPAKEVGGDFYDFFMLDENNIALVIADVSGKGVPAALFMVIAKILIKNQAQSGITPAEVFSKVNHMLCEGNDSGLFVTAWMGVLNIETGIMTCVNAGHNPPLILRNGEFNYIEQRPGFVLAGLDGFRYKQFDVELQPGDKVFLYTDGVTEATNKENKLYGEERLRNFLNSHKEDSVYDLVTKLRSDVDMFAGDSPQFDDITMLAFEYRNKQKTKDVIEKIFVATDSSLDEVNAFLTEELEKLECSMKALMQIQMAVEELFINVAHYGYPSNVGKVKITISKDDDMFVIKLADRGIPFNPLLKKDPDVTLDASDRKIGGLGIFMVKKAMDEVLYKFENGQNIVILKKRG